MGRATNRHLMAGALAGASSVAVVALASVLLLIVGLTWQFAYTRSIPVLRDFAGGGVAADMARIPEFLWGWRWALLGAAAAGAPMAWAERAVRGWPYRWRGRVVGAGLLAVVAAALGVGLLATADSTLSALDALPGNLPTLAERQPQVWNLLLVAALGALALAGALWISWSWWYDRWRGWLRAPEGARAAPAEVGSQAWLDSRAAHDAATRRIAALGAAGLALAIAGAAGFGWARPAVRSGDVWARPDSPNVAVRLTIDRPDRLLMVENTFGAGEVSVALLRESDQQPVSGPVTVRFTERSLGGERQTLDLAGLPEGRYLLNAQLRAGEGGRAGYALLQSRAAFVIPSALLASLGMGLALASGALLAGAAAGRQLDE